MLNSLCPHLARPVPFIYPLEKVIDRGYVGLGIGVYDVMGAGRGVPGHHRHLSRGQTVESFPSVKRSAIRGAVRFYEGQVDDARHTMMLSRTAADFGATCAFLCSQQARFIVGQNVLLDGGALNVTV